MLTAMATQESYREISMLGALSDDLRQRLYRIVRSTGRPVSRDEAAEQAGVSRKLAAFHLDKLVSAGLLAADFEPKSAWAGRPGRPGRPAKLYEPAPVEIDVTIPERHYDFVGEILVEAITGAMSGESPEQAARRVARDKGVALGREEAGERKLRRPGPERAMSSATDMLARTGFEPARMDDGSVILRNCPFHRLARLAPDLVCSLNQSFAEGLLAGLGNDRVQSLLRP
ncbi:MAG: helix-turn-helix transcriptional regulator, partial [Thermoplasmata archaeon]